MQRFLLVFTVLFALLAAPAAHAQSDLDLDGDTERSSSRKSARSSASKAVVREIQRGFYLKANAGTTVYFGARSQLLRPGTTLNLTFGHDVLDKPKSSVAWEINFYQALHNSTFGDYTEIAGLPRTQLIQGDVHVFGIMAGVEGSGYPVRRLGIGGHAGGGVAFVPLLLNRQYYDEDVIPTWGGVGNTPAVHQGAKPAIYAGPTIEYYTKLSHFSIGLDVDLLVIIGLDVGMSATGYFKYTF